MSRIVTMTVTVPTDDEALVEDVKAALLKIITMAGIQAAPERAAADGAQATLPGTPARIFFLAAGVKLGRVVASQKAPSRKVAAP